MPRALGGFIAGFIAVLTIHQGLLWLGTQLHWLHAAPWSMEPVPPFRIPAMLSLAFWGGVWGVVIAFVAPRIGTGPGYWISVFVLFGLATTLVGFTVVPMLKGQAMSEITLPRLLPGTILNGIWALATATLASVLPGSLRSR
jgi:hypothetical protein